MSMYGVAFQLRAQRRLGEAELLCREVLKECHEVLGPRHPDTLQATAGLAVLLKEQGKVGEAESLFREALQGYREVRGARHTTFTVATMHNLATLLSNQGRWNEAEPIAREALEASREVPGARHPKPLQLLKHLRQLLVKQASWARRRRCFARRSTGHREVLRGCMRHSRLHRHHFLQSQGNCSAVEPLYRGALEAGGYREVLEEKRHSDALKQLSHMSGTSFARVPP
jgi:tetratricopeptide (TPR) repeat protein